MKKIYRAEIDCANCAAKVERAMKKVKGVKNVNLNFMTGKLTFEADDANYDAVFAEAVAKAKRIEDDFSVEEYE